jgi:hypothetical protein
MTPALETIEALWFAPGTAADAAAAINRHRARVKHVSPAWVRRRWALSQKLGRLPPFERPRNGFTEGPREIVRRFFEIFHGREGRAA